MPAAAERAFVGIGANLGEAEATVRLALDALGRLPGCTRVAASSLYRSAPVQASGPDFVNAVAELQTTLEPRALLQQLQALEQTHGRVRTVRNAPRTLDLDLLDQGGRVWRDEALVLPHPRLHLRAFVLRPLLEIAPQLALPGLGPLAPWLAQVSGQAIERIGPA